MTKYDDYNEFEVQRDDPLILTCKMPISSSVNRIKSFNGTTLISLMTENKEIVI